MDSHQALVEKAKEAIDAVFSDQSVSVITTADSLLDLKTEIEVKLESLE